MAISKALVDTIDSEFREFFIVSLLILKAHCDDRGGVLASIDSSIYNYGRDYYSYVWPRDAVFALRPLVQLGYREEAVSFLRFCVRGMHPRGYMHHKYQPDGTLGSTWHPMIQNGRPELNIQEDETAAVLILFCEVVERFGLDDELQELYHSLVMPLTDFISEYIDHKTLLPHASYDLWEETFITSFYTTSAVIKALDSVIAFAGSFDPEKDTGHWGYSLDALRSHIGTFYSSEHQFFMKGFRLEKDTIVYDERLDASTLLAFLRYEPLPLDAASVSGTISAIEVLLKNPGPIGGIVRYPGDTYMKKHTEPNPWFICTFWLAEYFIRVDRIEDAKDIVRWSMKHAYATGALSEQLDPKTGYQVSVSPLVWSHAELINTLLRLAL